MKTYIAENIITPDYGYIAEANDFFRFATVKDEGIAKYRSDYKYFKRRYFKIGVSYDPNERFRNISSDNPFRVEIIETCNFDIEKGMHRILYNYNKNGEWFILCEEIYRLVIDFFRSINDNERLIKKALKYNPNFIERLIDNLSEDIRNAFDDLMNRWTDLSASSDDWPYINPELLISNE